MLQDRAGIARVAFAEDVRMAADELVGDVPAHFRKGEASFFAGDLGVHHHLEEKIPQFFTQIFIIVRADRFSHFVGFLEKPRD